MNRTAIYRKRKILDCPRFVSIDSYHRILEQMVSHLQSIPEIQSVYQVGGLSTPGISDIDIIAIFKNDVEYREDPRSILSEDGRYLFAHNLFGLPSSLVETATKNTDYHNYKLLAGDPVDVLQRPSKADTNEGKIQTALEFLVRAYTVTSFESHIGICKLRSLLLHTKALLYDFEFLGVNSGRLIDLVVEIVQRRQNWFEAPMDDRALNVWLESFKQELESFLNEQLQKHTISMPGVGPFVYSKSIHIVKADQLKFVVKRNWVPKMFRCWPKYYPKFVNRLSRFELQLPFSNDNRLVTRFDALTQLAKYNRRFLPCFYPLGTHLGVC